MIRYKKVHVFWIDSSYCNGWHDKKTIKEWYERGTLQCETLGFLIIKTKEYIVVALSIDIEDGDTCDCMKIPMCCVKKIKYIK